MTRPFRSFLRLAFRTAGLAGVIAATSPSAPVRAAPVAIASGVTYEALPAVEAGHFESVFGTELASFMGGSPMPPSAYVGKFPAAKYRVRLYRVHYPSVVPERDNQPTVASGLVAVPEGAGTRLPMVDYQHGTVFQQMQVPSHLENCLDPKAPAYAICSFETMLMVGAFAAQGYVVVAPDYFGRGDSPLPDSYLVKASTQQASVDMLRAGRAVLADLKIEPTQLFVSGWSQGGWAAMAVLQKLEQQGEAVTAAAAASAPVDVHLTVKRWLENPQPVDAIYLTGCAALQVLAQEYYSQRPGLAASAIRADYLESARAFYRGEMDFTTFVKKTTPHVSEFFDPSFVAAGDAGAGPYWHLLEESQAYRWRARTPVRTYYGGRDEVTPIAIGKLPAQTQAIVGGAPAVAIDTGDMADHRGVFVAGILDQKPWFDSLRRN